MFGFYYLDSKKVLPWGLVNLSKRHPYGDLLETHGCPQTKVNPYVQHHGFSSLILIPTHGSSSCFQFTLKPAQQKLGNGTDQCARHFGGSTALIKKNKSSNLVIRKFSLPAILNSSKKNPYPPITIKPHRGIENPTSPVIDSESGMTLLPAYDLHHKTGITKIPPFNMDPQNPSHSKENPYNFHGVLDASFEDQINILLEHSKFTNDYINHYLSSEKMNDKEKTILHQYNKALICLDTVINKFKDEFYGQAIDEINSLGEIKVTKKFEKKVNSCLQYFQIERPATRIAHSFSSSDEEVRRIHSEFIQKLISLSLGYHKIYVMVGVITLLDAVNSPHHFKLPHNNKD